MIWVLAALVFVAGFGAACWWGSNVVFHPPKMLPHTVFPDQFGLRYEAIRLQAADGVPLAAWAIPAAEATERTLLLLHGWGDNKGDVLRRTYSLARRFNLLLLDHRNHGESGGPRSTIGFLESRDVEAALDWLRSQRPAWAGRLGVFGLSMGGAIAVWAAAKHPDLRCVAAEAPFPSFNRVVGRYTYNGFKLPYFPFAWSALKVIAWRLGEDPEPYSPLYHIERVAPRPILFIAGERDTLMPLADVRELFERATSPKELWVVPGATHGRCEEVAGDAYHAKLLEFFDTNIPKA